jgi:phage head maturation protease
MTKLKLSDHPVITRPMPLLDIERGGSDGRTLTAYASTFGNEYPVNDFDGDYDETINRAAFNRHLGQHGFGRVRVMFNHGLNVFHTPSDRFALPIATPVDVRADGRGLLTVSRYASTDLADEVLRLIEDGAVKEQSFRGPVIRSAPVRVGSDGRRKIERLELGLTEYGPAWVGANPDAKFMALRSMVIDETLAAMTDEERADLLEKLQGTPPEVDPLADEEIPEDTPDTTPIVVVPVEDPSNDINLLANANRRRRYNEQDTQT